MNALAAGLFDSSSTRFVIVAFVAIAGGALVIAVSFVIAKRQGAIERRLAGYEPVAAATRPLSQAEVFDHGGESTVVTNAVDKTREFAERAGVLTKVELFLEQANVPLRPAELLFYGPVFTVLLGLIAVLLFGVFSGLIALVVAALVPVVFLVRKRSGRLRKFENQLPDSLNLLAGSMRAGFSFMQGFEAIANEAAEPAKRELQRVFTEARLGRNVDDAMEECAERMNSKDMHWVVMALRIQREVGGNLAELLDTVANTMTQRERLRREIQALTAEGRFSGYVLTAMPFFFLLLFQVMQPDYVPKLFTEMIGIIASIGACVGIIVGWIWLRKIVNIEV